MQSPGKYTGNVELLRRARDGDLKARDELISLNLGLVRSVSRRFAGRGGADIEDLFQIGCIGLIKAAQKFDESFGVQFSTYAVPMIIGEIRRFLRDDGAVKISRSLKELAQRAGTEKERLCFELGREPTVGEIAARIGAEPAEIAAAFEATAQPESMNAAFGPEEDGLTLEDRLSVGGLEEEAVEKIALHEMLKTLGDRDRALIILRYLKNKTQAETAQCSCICRSAGLEAREEDPHAVRSMGV